MYNAYFGFKQNPFSITPNPEFLYLSSGHQEALSHLIYGVSQGGGFVALTGEVGTGKTTLIRSLLEQEIGEVEVALCLNPQLTAQEFVANICDELGVAYSENATLKKLIDSLNRHLLEAHAQGRRVVVIIDEAQQLSRDVLEEVRLLTNLETASEKLLTIILVGQPELQSMLARNDLRQLSQRITTRSHITPLAAADTAAYVRHRVRVAGGHPDVFSLAALKRIHALTGGIPRLVNVLCERSLMGAYSAEKRQVTRAMVNRAAAESLGKTSINWLDYWWLAALLFVVLAGLLGWCLGQNSEATLADAAAPQTPPVAVSDATKTSSSAQESLVFSVNHQDATAAQLAALWQQNHISSRDELCSQLLDLELRCLGDEPDWVADWAYIQRLNRPMLLSLNTHGQQVSGLLISINNDDSVTIFAGERPQRISVAHLMSMWNRQFTAIVRNQSGSDLLSPGQRDKSVIWLRQRLSLADGQPMLVGAGAEFYDQALQGRVQAFQSKHGLKADGLVGILTISLLDNLAPRAGTPTLIREAS